MPITNAAKPILAIANSEMPIFPFGSFVIGFQPGPSRSSYSTFPKESTVATHPAALSGATWRDADDRWLDRVFFEETRDHRRIEIGPHAVDGVAVEVDDPAVPVVEPQSVLRRRQGPKLHDSLIVLHEQMLDDELSAVGQNLS